jgi:predicted metalloprotease with PDZ domain
MDSHLVHVAMTIPGAGAGTRIQFPAWNALYEIRDFVKDVQSLKAECDGRSVNPQRVDLDTWSGPPSTCANLTFRYSVFADEDGPYDAMLNSQHAFLNLALILFYLPKERLRSAQIDFEIPPGWKLTTLLDGSGLNFTAENYDALVDSPVDAGHFEEHDYTQPFTATDGNPPQTKQAMIRVIIDANPEDYSAQKILNSLQKITQTETGLMQDLPFDRYAFILQFPRDGGSTGGMEHRNGAAISIPASSIRNDASYLDNVAAHEFFHLWNVKRIRPQALEPVDYVNGNDTRDLWFCEGVTNTYAELVLLRAGLIDRKTFYDRVVNAIQLLESRPARRDQSAETSGREAWLEKYSDYNRIDRSVSYYNKGELLGYLLDLGMRHASGNRAGLDDLLRRLDQDFARKGRFYTLSDLVAIVKQLAPAFDIDHFVAEDVQGTAELDYATYLEYAGIKLTRAETDLAEPGFTSVRNSDGQLEVDSVTDGSGAERGGLLAGDVLISADRKALPTRRENGLPDWHAGQLVDLQVQRHDQLLDLTVSIDTNREKSFAIDQDAKASSEQLAVRNGWLKGVTALAAGTR